MNQVDALERQLKETKELVERRERALKLAKNPDFQALILEEFMVQECARYAHTSADPSRTAEERADALALAQSAGHLKRFLSVCVQQGQVAENSIAEIEEAIVEAHAAEDAQ